jgi:phage anti-repressor protein
MRILNSDKNLNDIILSPYIHCSFSIDKLKDIDGSSLKLGRFTDLINKNVQANVQLYAIHSVTKQDIVTYKFHELIVNQNQTSLSLCDFFDISNFDPSQFFDSTFWCALNSLEDDEWFEVSDDIIEIIGYKGTEARIDHIRDNLFRFIKKQFVENVDYIFSSPLLGGKSIRSVGRNKLTLKMKRDSFKMVLMKSNTQNSDQIYRYLIAFENQVKKYAMYQSECEMYKKNVEITQLKAQTQTAQTPPPLNKYQQNRLKSALE